MGSFDSDGGSMGGYGSEEDEMSSGKDGYWGSGSDDYPGPGSRDDVSGLAQGCRLVHWDWLDCSEF